jgi:hypothetical protein
MPGKNDFFDILPNDRRAQILFKHLDRCLEADDPEIFHMRVRKFISALDDGISLERQKELDSIKSLDEYKKKNSFAVANVLLSKAVHIMSDMGFSEGEKSILVDNQKIVTD